MASTPNTAATPLKPPIAIVPNKGDAKIIGTRKYAY